MHLKPLLFQTIAGFAVKASGKTTRTGSIQMR
jgi:hypothetical protein